MALYGFNYELVRMTTVTTGTGSSLTLGSPVSGFLAVPAAADGVDIYYGIRDGAHSEVGHGIYTHSGTTLARNVIASTNSNSRINLSGTAEVFIGPFAAVLQAIFDATVQLTGNQSVAGIKTFSGNNVHTGLEKFQALKEKVTITAGAPASTQNFDVLTQAIQYFTSANANNWTLNVRGDGSTSLDSLMSTGDAITIAVVVTNTGTAYRHTAMTIDGNAVTPQWLGAAAPSAGTINKRDTYQFTIIKTGSATFIVQASFAAGN